MEDVSILLVENDHEAAERLTGLLADEGYDDVAVADSVAQAVRALATHAAARPPELVLADLPLTDGTGVELCRRLAQARGAPRIPIVVVTPSDDETAIAACLDAGAADVVHAPVRPRELAARLRVALRLKQARDEQWSREHRLLGLAERLRQSNEELAKLSSTDALTGVANRRQFNLVYHNEWRRAARAGTCLGLVLFDIDDFHDFNAVHGHLAGDRCLVAVAQAIASAGHRPSDLFARYGGEEFVHVLPDTNDDGASIVARRALDLVRALAIPRVRGIGPPYVTISAGVASLVPRLEVSPEVLIAAADDALLRAKHDGRDRYELSSQSCRDPVDVTIDGDAEADADADDADADDTVQQPLP
jgi:diguanylate cyclase (GGDEF)-like protein